MDKTTFVEVPFECKVSSSVKSDVSISKGPRKTDDEEHTKKLIMWTDCFWCCYTCVWNFKVWEMNVWCCYIWLMKLLAINAWLYFILELYIISILNCHKQKQTGLNLKSGIICRLDVYASSNRTVGDINHVTVSKNVLFLRIGTRNWSTRYVNFTILKPCVFIKR